MFEKIYGNEIPKKIISQMINKKRISHAIILTGETGLGKLTFAKEIAKQVAYSNNLNKAIEDCVDINIVDAGESGTIPINTIREMKNKLNVTPYEGLNKIQIIAGCEKMTVAAQNAILKSLEEPSKSTMFILTTPNIYKLLETIRSRAIIINMEPIPKDKALEILSIKFPEVSKTEINKYIKILGGNLGLIENLINDNSLVTPMIKLCEDLLLNIITNNEYLVMKSLSIFSSSKNALPNFLELFKIYFEKILRIYLKSEDLTEIIPTRHLTCFSSLESYTYISDVVNKALSYISSNANFNLLLSWLSANLISGNNQT